MVYSLLLFFSLVCIDAFFPLAFMNPDMLGRNFLMHSFVIILKCTYLNIIRLQLVIQIVIGLFVLEDLTAGRFVRGVGW